MLQSTTPDKRGTTQLGLHVLTDRSPDSSPALCNPNQILSSRICPASEVFTFGGDQALLTKFAARLAG